MNLKEQLEEKKAQLLELKAGVEAGEKEATASARALVDEITSLKEQIKDAEEKHALLDAMSSAEPIDQIEQKETDMDLIESAIEAVKGVNSADRFNVSTGFKAATDLHTAPVVKDTDKTIPALPNRKAAASMVGAATINGNAVTYYVEKADEGDVDVVAEGGKKPQVKISYDEKTASLKKIAGFIKESTELLEDADFLASAIENKLLYKLYKAEDAEVVSTLVAGAGKTATYDQSETNAIAEAVAEAISTISNGSAYEADGVFMNPADVVALRLAKDSNGQYYGGGFMTGAYGNGDIKPATYIWGLPVFETSDIDSGTVLVGAFKQCATVYRKNGVNVSVSNSNEDDFIYNRVTVLAEERIVPVVTVPAGIVKITASTSTAQTYSFDTTDEGEITE